MFKNLPDYQAADPSLWQGRNDTPNQRFFQNIEFIDNEEQLNTKTKHKILIGFGCDAGIIRNHGRAGAKLGPDQIKTHLARLPCSWTNSSLDLGSIVCPNDDLESAQKQFASLISLCQQHGHKTIGLGGGHEIAWAHYQGLATHHKNLGIINFDAHFDLRPWESGQKGTSGTPFTQIANFCKQEQRPFQYCCVGIQKLGNTANLFQTAKNLNVHTLLAEDLILKSLAEQKAFLDKFIHSLDAIYLTICLDAFAECFAPGVSAPQVLGITPWQALPLLKHIAQSGKVVSMDIAELSPPLDPYQKTARLAAIIVAELLDII